MNHCTATPYSRLLGCCSRGEVRVHMSVGLAATHPYKPIIYNALYALSLARGGAMRRGCWASHAEGALSAPEQTITILNGTRSAAFPWVVALNAEDGQKQMGISNGYDPAVITHWNDLGDGGNTVRIEKASTFDATAALAAIKALETGIEKSKS